ncbi:hypothetical protein E2562_011623 [Oryza meyeriana var. granulata]|uniref:Uncharacterized protein n=1 Tax=Oryza meyeriana var. granulata TaxID=110450 RepID=A0A6G1DX64_9ORYZ|nr:hypothetical protein E2562_011623 [Oryza meyeriana var. granulata]
MSAAAPRSGSGKESARAIRRQGGTAPPDLAGVLDLAAGLLLVLIPSIPLRGRRRPVKPKTC